MLYAISKENHNTFLEKIAQREELFAPVKTDALRFEKIDDSKDICLDGNSDFPLKEFFFRNREMLFRFSNGKLSVEIDEAKTRVFFGIRRCDLNAIAHQDFIFMEKHQDPYYTAQRKKAVLMGYHCNEAPSPYCFCSSMDLEDCYDLMFFDRGDHYLVDVGSKKGQSYISDLFEKTDKELTQEDTNIEHTDRLKDKDISKHFDNPGWQKGADRCLSCAACTTLCPTCYCHEIKDEVSLEDLKKGKRIREWSSCQLKSFTRVAGDHVFREERVERFKHRIYHQLQYFKERYGVEMCVGCGRCISHCPTKIDFVEIINEMNDEK